MFYSTPSLSRIVISTLLLTYLIYGKTVSKYSDTEVQTSNILLGTNQKQSAIGQADVIIRKKQALLSKTQKSRTIEYISLYDEIAELTISKNNLLMKMDKVDDINSGKTCDFALKYEEIEFVKTEYYKTPFHDEVAKTLENLTKLYEQCQPVMAEKYFNSVLQIKEHIYGKVSVEAAKAFDALGDYYRIYMADFKQAILDYETAKNIREEVYGLKDPRVTENYERLAVSLYYHGDKRNRAEKLLLDSINIRKNAHFSNNFPLYIAYMDVGIYYSMKDEYDKSIMYLQKALKSFQGKVNRNYIVIVGELSQIYLNQDNLRKAQKFGEEAYRVSREFYGSDTHFSVLENALRLTEIKNRMKK